MQKNEKIKIHILAPLALGLVVITITTILLIYKFQSEHVFDTAEINISHTNRLIHLILTEKTELLSSLNSAIRRDNNLQNAWLTKDRQTLLQHSSLQFREMQEKYRITHFYFIGLDRKVFLRVHHPPLRGDTIKRSTLQQSIQTGKMGSGLELGLMGAFTLRVVHSWRINGQLVGYIELGQEIGHIITDLHKLMGVELMLMVNKNLLDKASWQQTMLDMGRSNQWSQFNDLAMVSSTLKNASMLEKAAYQSQTLQHKNTILPHISSDDGHKFSFSSIPLLDAAKQNVGYLIILSDVTKEQAAINKLTYRVIFAPVFIALILFFSFYRYIGSVEKKLSISRSRLLEESMSREAAMAHARDIAEETTQLKSQFLANMSHELRTPMNGVMGMLQLLNETPLTEEQQKYSQLASHSADLLITLINDILDLSKIEAGKLGLECIVFDVRTTLEEVAESLSEIAYQKGLEITCLIQAGTPISVFGDPYRLRQILNNLIGNAIKFTSEGEIIIRMGPQITEENKNMLHFEVIDSGIGIPSDKQISIFEPFIQADGSTTRNYGGTGLGLAISKRIIKQMGGHIGVNSTLGKGSCFYFNVPLELVDENQQTVLSFTDIQGLRILLVNSTNTIAELLQTLNLHVEHLTNGDDVIDKLQTSQAQEKTFPVVIFDQLSATPVFEIAKKIKATNTIAHSHLILLTSFGHRGDAHAAHQAGIDAFLTKPVRQQLLYDCLASVMGIEQHIEKPLVTKHSLAEQQHSQKAHILLAEDDEVNQMIVVAMLKKLGYQVDIAADGLNVLLALKNKQYHLVLMDCHMPNMDGYETSQQIRKSTQTWKDIPIVALTANTLATDKEQCKQAGMNEYLSKPIKQKELENVLARFLSK